MTDELTSLGFPQIFEDIWLSETPDVLGSRFGSPKSMVDALNEHPDGFCRTNDIVPLWEVNSSYLVAYLKPEGSFIEWCYEDRPDNYEVIANTYEVLLGYVFRPFLYSKSE